MSHRSRRDVLRTAGITTAGLLAGCLGLRGPTLEEFDYPAGFSRDAIDPHIAFGSGSPNASVDTIALDTEWEFVFADWSTSTMVTGRFDLNGPRFERERRSLNTLEQRLHILGEYFDSTEVFQRGRVEPRSIEDRYSARAYDWSPLEELRLDELRRLLTDVDLTADRVATVDDRTMAIYLAQETEIGEQAPLRQFSESIGDLSSATLELGVMESGYITDVSLVGTLLSVHGDAIDLKATWDYDGVNDTTVTRPDWLDDVPAIDRPEVVVHFDEVNGDAVVVDIREIRHTDQVAIVIDGEGVYESLSNPGSVEISASDYLDDEGVARSIFVFAENQLRGPVEIEVYRPE